MTTILVSAGDLSGERHAADLVRAIRSHRDDVRFLGMGGAAMEAAGVELVVDQRELAVGGIFEALTSLVRIASAWRAMLRAIRESKPNLVILVDSGGFNLPLARRARRISQAKVLYYVAPQVWAWREKRIHKLASRSDRIAVILPFEKEFYATRGIDVDYVGHPIVDPDNARESKSLALTAESARERKRTARERLGFDPNASVLGLFPGSRRSEIDQHLAIWIESFRRLRRDRGDLQAVIAVAPSLDRLAFEKRLASLAGEVADSIHVASGESPDALDAADVALAKPGTITLELLIRGIPMVVAGRVHPWTARIVRRSLRTAFVAMPNLLVGKEIVPERIQEEAQPEQIAEALSPLFEGARREAQLAAFERVGALLVTPGTPAMGGAARRGAQIVEEMLGSHSS